MSIPMCLFKKEQNDALRSLLFQSLDYKYRFMAVYYIIRIRHHSFKKLIAERSQSKFNYILQISSKKF